MVKVRLNSTGVDQKGKSLNFNLILYIHFAMMVVFKNEIFINVSNEKLDFNVLYSKIVFVFKKLIHIEDILEHLIVLYILSSHI